MPELNKEELERYLGTIFKNPVSLVGTTPLGKDRSRAEVKGFGYGIPLKVDFRMNGQCCSAVLHTIKPGRFGHEHMSDRARELLWEHEAFNRLPRHVRSLDVGAFQPGGRLASLGNTEEFCLLTDYVEGESYSHDLERIRETGIATELDLARADALCDYLVGIHCARANNPDLYIRRIRELVGDGECIMGIADSYPNHRAGYATFLESVEYLCVEWRWRLKKLTHRLRQVHGDFHPWNILFQSADDFAVLDRSRGEYGEPADDVTSLTLNYLFFSLQRSGRLEGAFGELFLRFWRRYLEKSGDREILAVAAPFFAFRGLVMASPVWYPNLSDSIRRKLFMFVMSVLKDETFSPQKANDYCAA